MHPWELASFHFGTVTEYQTGCLIMNRILMVLGTSKFKTEGLAAAEGLCVRHPAAEEWRWLDGSFSETQLLTAQLPLAGPQRWPCCVGREASCFNGTLTVSFNHLHLRRKDKDTGFGVVPFWDLESCQETWLTFLSVGLLSMALAASANRPGQETPAETCRQPALNAKITFTVLARCWLQQSPRLLPRVKVANQQ